MSTSFFDDDDDDDLNINADESQLSRTSAGVSAASRAGPSRPGQDARHQQQQRRQQSVVNDGRTDTRTARQREKSRDTSAFGGDEMELDLDAEGDGLGKGKGKGAGQDASETETETEVEQLMRHWMDERMAPEVLGHREELVNRLMARLEAQTEAASLLASSAASKPEEHERILLVQMEIERVRYLLRAYLRTRTYKIETYAQDLLRTPGAKRKLTDVEYGYAQRYYALLEKHYTASVVQNLPERLGRLDEEEMIIKPDLDTAVFAYARRNCPPIRLPDGQQLEMGKGEIHMLRYRTVRRLLRDGDVKLV